VAACWNTVCVTRRRRSATLLLVLAGAVVAGGPATAEERLVQIGRDGVRPQVLQVEPGDTVRFVNEDPTFAYRAQSTGGPWRFDSGPTALLEGDFAVPEALTQPGTHTYRVAQDAPFAGSVVVAGAVPPTAAPTAAPSPAPAPGGSSVAATPAPVAAPAVPGPLPGQRSSRGLGLAVAVAAVLLLGAASLQLRLLLAVPVSAPVLSDRPARL
jgi:plastocyanin